MKCMYKNPTQDLQPMPSWWRTVTGTITMSIAHLGCFIQPSRCMCPPASLSCWPGELPLSRHRPSDRCSEQSLDMPHVAGRQGEHFGWHKAWHSEEKKHCETECNCRQGFGSSPHTSVSSSDTGGTSVSQQRYVSLKDTNLVFLSLEKWKIQILVSENNASERGDSSGLTPNN